MMSHRPDDRFAGHTPGPWTCRDGAGQYTYEVVGKSPRGKDIVVARVSGGPTHREGNARLIAAAPDLLAENAALRAERDALQRGATDVAVFVYEREFYPLSNFSAFRLEWAGIDFDTSEHAYHFEKFHAYDLATLIRTARSAHEAFKLAESHKSQRRTDWNDVKVDIMRAILRAKADQHEYVRRKLLETGDREIIEDSWRDDFWGWGPHRDGQNMLGKLWMEIRSELHVDLAGGSGVTDER